MKIEDPLLVLTAAISLVILFLKTIEITSEIMKKDLNEIKNLYVDLIIVIYTLFYQKIKKIEQINLSSFNMSQANLSRIILTPESQVHFEELSEEIRELEEDTRISRLTIWRLLILEMWLEEKYADKIWLPYLSKIWLFFETQIMGIFTRF